MALLQTQALSVHYGGVKAVDQVDLRVEPGQLVALIGPNGAGKTTFIDALTGLVRQRGRIVFNGADISRLPAHRRPQDGLSRTWQSVGLFEDLTVRENLRVAGEPFGMRTVVRDLVRRRPSAEQDGVDEALDALDLRDVGDLYPGQLSQGRRKLVGIARGLMSRPKLLCMDEPAAGLDSRESRSLGAVIRGLVGSGLSGLIVEHDMGLVMTICDYIYVLEFGRIIAHGTPDVIRTNERVLLAYLGTRKGRGLEMARESGSSA